MTERTRLLCVDDEHRVLEGIELQLRRDYEVTTATCAVQGLEKFLELGPFPIVMSDMRMPSIDGAQFLGQIKQCNPNTVRLLLTGQSDVADAITAINEGGVFRFLKKPCSKQQLLRTLATAAEQYQLLKAEQDLLERTLRGSIEALMNVLALINPLAFGRANRLESIVQELSKELRLKNSWYLELAAMLSQIGMVSLEPELAQKVYGGAQLTDQERDQVNQSPQVAAKLISDIPRLEPVTALIDSLSLPLADASEVAQCLHVALDYDTRRTRLGTNEAALGELVRTNPGYTGRVLEAIKRVGTQDESTRMLTVNLAQLKVGMKLLEDVYLSNGTLLVARGYDITEGFLERIARYPSQHIKQPIFVLKN